VLAAAEAVVAAQARALARPHGAELDAAREPAAPPPPWRRDASPVDPSPAQQSWRPYPDEEPEPEPEVEPEPPPAPEPPPPAPRTGSIGPPGYESGAHGPLPSDATVAPRSFDRPVPDQRWVLAEWWRRAVAYLLDAIIIGVIVTLIIVIITSAAGGVGFLGGDATGYGGIVLGLLFSTLIAAAVAVLYAPFYMARTNGQTLGKQVMGIRVVRASGQPVDFLWSVLREVIIKAVVFAGLGSSITFGLAWLIDCLWPLWDDENRALHDLIVDSRVVRA
jgi:uncharacterized RDD family membrane protein YckC